MKIWTSNMKFGFTAWLFYTTVVDAINLSFITDSSQKEDVVTHAILDPDWPADTHDIRIPRKMDKIVEDIHKEALMWYDHVPVPGFPETAAIYNKDNFLVAALYDSDTKKIYAASVPKGSLRDKLISENIPAFKSSNNLHAEHYAWYLATNGGTRTPGRHSYMAVYGFSISSGSKPKPWTTPCMDICEKFLNEHKIGYKWHEREPSISPPRNSPTRSGSTSPPSKKQRTRRRSLEMDDIFDAVMEIREIQLAHERRAKLERRDYEIYRFGYYV